jgi:hypothetical protein
MSRTILVTGGTGLIGATLVKRLVERGDTVTVLTRDPRRASVPKGAKAEAWTPTEAGPWQRLVDGTDAIVHLAGDPVVGGRWTDEKKQRIRDSRIVSASLLVDACRDAEKRPKVFVGGSAIGIYGHREPGEDVREDARAADDFLARVVVDWEAATKKAEPLGIRTVLLRTGVVLDPEGGALKEMLLPFRLHVGGPIGDGRQVVAWIHHEDMIQLLLLALDDERVRGPLNAVAPHPVDMNTFARTLGEALGSRSWLRVPAAALRLRFGEAADPILNGARVLPAAAESLGYRFRFPDLGPALRDLLLATRAGAGRDRESTAPSGVSSLPRPDRAIVFAAMTGQVESDATGSLQRILSSEEDDRLVDDLLDALPVGVIVLDDAGRVIRYNKQEQALAHRSRGSVLGRSFFGEVAPCTRASELFPAFNRYIEEGVALREDLSFQFPFPHYPTPREVRLRLRGFSSREKRFAFLLVEDVTEEVQAQRLRELLATLVAHDMKNPLTAVRLNVDMVLRDLSSTRTAERLGEARTAADRLDRMIRLFLDVYRLETAEIVLTPSRFDASSLLNEVVHLQRPLAEASGVALAAETTPCPLVSDAALVQRIIDNLLDNALRHASSTVSVRVGPDAEGGLCLEVEDDGPGVPDDGKGRVFDKFATMAVDLRGYNQGLGLTFCSLATAKLGGSIDVRDASPKGAIFRLKLPTSGNHEAS